MIQYGESLRILNNTAITTKDKSLEIPSSS